MPRDEFGGIEVDSEEQDEFGGVAIAEDVGSQFMSAPPMPWVRNPSVEQRPPDERTLGERATASLAQGGIGLQQGFHGLGEQGWSAIQAAYEPIVELGPIALTPSGLRLTSTARENAAFARETALEARKRSQALEPLAAEIGGAPIMRTIGQAIPSVAPALAFGPLGFPAAIAASGAQAGGATLSEAQSVFEQQPEERRTVLPNVEFWDAAGPAALDAIQTAAITAVSGRIFGQGVEGATVPMRREAIKQTVGSRAKEVFGEVIEEGAQQFLSDYVVAQMSYNPAMTFDQALRGAIDAAIAGGIVGGGLVSARAITEPRMAPSEAPLAIPLERPAGAIDELAINRALEQRQMPIADQIKAIDSQLAEFEQQLGPRFAFNLDTQRAEPARILDRKEAELLKLRDDLTAQQPVKTERKADAIHETPKTVLRDVQQPEVAQEGQVAVPPDEGQPPTGEALERKTKPSSTKWGRKKGDIYNEGMPEKIIAVKDDRSGTLDDEYTVSEFDQLLSDNEVTLRQRDMTADEIKVHRQRLQKENEMRTELGQPTIPIPEVETKSPVPETKPPPPAAPSAKELSEMPIESFHEYRRNLGANQTREQARLAQSERSALEKAAAESQAKAQKMLDVENVDAALLEAALAEQQRAQFFFEALSKSGAPELVVKADEPAKPIPMGAATSEEFKPPVPFTTSNKNAVVDEERKARGLPPMMALERETRKDAWDEAMRIIDDNPQAQDELIAELAVQAFAPTPVQNAMLMQRRIDLRNEYEKALRRWREAFEFDDMVRAAEESLRVREWSSKLSDLEDITKATGHASSISLSARKTMANEDFSLAAMELRAMEAKGRALTPEEHIELIKAQERIVELENRLLQLESNRASIEIAKGTAETMGDVSREAPKEAKSKDFDVDREENLLSGIKAKVDKGQTNEITPLVQQLARLFWRRGIRQREPMIDALHQTLGTIIPGFTRDQTQRAFSGYGNFTPLSKAEIDVGLRDLRGQTQQVLKMEALEARKPLEKTGQERRVPSDEERRLIKQVNELKRKYGVVVTDPATQLKSALAARKTYYEHRIADLKHEIETRQRILKDKTAPPTDPELDALIAEHERLKAEHEQIFVRPEMSDEQRLKMAIAGAERNQAHWEVRLKNAEKGVFDKRVPGRKVTSPELELIQAETAAIREHVKELHDLDAAVLEAKRTESLERQKANLEKHIAEQERKLREGDLTGPGKRMARPADPALEELLQKRDALNKQLKEARKKPEAQKYAEAQQRELERLNKAIAEREAKIAAGDISTEPKKVSRPLPPELEQARQKLEAVNKQLAEMRKAARPVKTKEEIALQALKTRMKSSAAEFHRRILAKDFAKRVRAPVKLDPEGLKLKAELEINKEKFQAALEKDRWDRSSVFEKTKARAWGVYDLVKTIMATGEFSFILRQGKGAFLESLVSPKRAVIFAKAVKDGIRAMRSELKQREIEQDIFSDPMYSLMLRDKLYVPEHGTRLSKQEEFAMGRYADAIPGVNAFNRAAETFLKKIRADNYKLMAKSMTATGVPTPEEGAIIARFLNESTGRGGLGKAEPAAVVLNRFFFSPRYLMSRLQLASGHALWSGTWQGTGRARLAVAQSYARMLIGASLYYTMLLMLFDRDDEDKVTVETNPKSSDFGKLKIGETRLDPMAGLAQITTMAVRSFTGEAKDTKGETFPIVGEVPFGKDDWVNYAARFARSKLHPTIGGAIDLRMEKNMVGEPVTLTSRLTESGPMTYYDIYEALRANEIDHGVAMSLLALLGEGLKTYE